MCTFCGSEITVECFSVVICQVIGVRGGANIETDRTQTKSQTDGDRCRGLVNVLDIS